MPVELPVRNPISAVRSRATRIAEMVATPLVPTDYLDLLDPLASSSELRGRIVSIVPETPDSATLVVQPGRGWKRHVPGQYIRVGVDIRGIRQWRAYSLTSSPDREDGNITVTVKAIEDGLVSNFLVHEVTAGTVIQLDQACGEFTLGEGKRERTLFLTAGSGITPVMGMLRGAADQLEDVVVIHSAPAERDVIFRRELRAMSEEGRIELFEIHTDLRGMLDPVNLSTLVPDLGERDIWACGPTGMLDSLEAHLESMGLLHRLHTERFRPSVIVTGDGGEVTFTESELSVDADGAKPLLEVGEESGVLMPSGCRMGICFGCVSPLREVAVRDLRSGEITTASEGEEILIQTCVSAAAGNCQIKL